MSFENKKSPSKTTWGLEFAEDQFQRRHADWDSILGLFEVQSTGVGIHLGKNLLEHEVGILRTERIIFEAAIRSRRLF